MYMCAFRSAGGPAEFVFPSGMAGCRVAFFWERYFSRFLLDGREQARPSPAQVYVFSMHAQWLLCLEPQQYPRLYRRLVNL